MVPSNLSIAPAATTDLAAQRRSEDIIAAYIDTGIRLQSSHGTTCALEYLQSHDVAPSVIQRVLSRPGKRRNSA
ncbi:hypothetical protein [Undibacterium oligocarboniphilum]|uniref:Uncharacterized protein n=1 Tax=Undibacterium oligocarboniphilum TaxID=666702 RepID=A0A850QA28_9BURK|nr:hypothetical protein [Undibacterium oligocarboniphilum]MBC3869202.1 hypothetical protein [Undibacterium oligocarboniphilum]NVO77182.1 hypothetical protein [Undibacterium oligocarboniphilum]